MAQIICRDLSLGYDGNVIASNLNFSVDCGDYLCVVGENGSGKSTLVKALLGLIKPVSGNIETGDGYSATSTGYLPQQTELQSDFPASVREVVMSGCTAAKRGLFFGGRAKALAEYNMKRLEIDKLFKKSFRDLSGGQQQRVFLARALCAASGMLLLDEPVTGLDPMVTAELYSILEKLNKEEKMTIIMVSHDISAAIKYATHILHMGRNSSFFGTVEEYLTTEKGRTFARGGSDSE